VSAEVAGETLVMERSFRAPAERVFDAFTEPEVMRRWWHAEREWETAIAEVDLRVGGAVRVVMLDPEQGVSYGGGGEYTVVDRPTRLAFTWAWDDGEHGGRPNLIEIELVESAGATHVTFTHRGLADAEAVRSHEGGWNGTFENLARALAAG
jgi:uncharacterized protein YndB with AHSA1/START domain